MAILTAIAAYKMPLEAIVAMIVKICFEYVWYLWVLSYAKLVDVMDA